MKIARFDGGRIGVVIGDRIHDVSDACGVDPAEWPPMGMITTIAAFDELVPGHRARPRALGRFAVVRRDAGNADSVAA